MKTRKLKGKIRSLFGCLIECFSLSGWHPSQGYHQDEHDTRGSSTDDDDDGDGDNDNTAPYDNPKGVWYYRFGNRWKRYYEQHQQILEEAFQQNLLNSNDHDKVVRVVKLQAKRRTFEVDLKEMRQTSVHRLHKTKRDVVRKVFAYDNTRRDRVDGDYVPAKPGYQLYITIMKNENEDTFLHDFDLFYQAEYDPSIPISSAFVATDQAQSTVAEEESDQENDDNNNTMTETIQQDDVQDSYSLCDTTRNLDDNHQKAPSMMDKPGNDEGHFGNDENSHHVQQDGVNDGDVLCGRTRNLDDHPGNKYYTTLIDEYADDYTTASATTKKIIISDIIRRVEEKGKFKYPVSGTRKWAEISDPQERQKRNRDKVCHALRLRARKTKIEQQKQRQHRRQQNQQQQQTAQKRTSSKSVSQSRRKRNTTRSADKTEANQEKRSKVDPCKTNELLQNQQLFFEAYIKDGLVDCDKTTVNTADTALVTPMKSVSWEWKQGRSTWNPYSLSNQYSLEEEYRNYTKTNMNLYSSKVSIKAAEQTYEIDLVEMTQKNIDTGKTRIIRRRELN